MTISVDLDALIAEARADDFQCQECGLNLELADALESTLAELRQERERADAAERALRATDDYRVADWQKLELERDEAEAALSRAEETIEKVRNLPRHELNALVTAVDAHDIDTILTEYGKQKSE